MVVFPSESLRMTVPSQMQRMRKAKDNVVTFTKLHLFQGKSLI